MTKPEYHFTLIQCHFLWATACNAHTASKLGKVSLLVTLQETATLLQKLWISSYSSRSFILSHTHQQLQLGNSTTKHVRKAWLKNNTEFLVFNTTKQLFLHETQSR